MKLKVGVIITLISFTSLLIRRTVLTPREGSCYVSSQGDVRTPPLLSSLLTTDTGCGSPQTPWIVEVQPGQQINFTLIDFASSSNASHHSSRFTIFAYPCLLWCWQRVV